MTQPAYHIAVSPEFFAHALRDYQDPLWAFAREFLQNCFDAPRCTRVDIKIDPDGTVQVSNNGAPMTHDELFGKLLSLGGTGKAFENGAVGGFGRAKEILLFSQQRYEIWSGQNHVTGSGGSFHTQACNNLNGTCSRVVTRWKKDDLERAFRSVVTLSNWGGQVFINGVEVPGRMIKGTFRRDFKWGRVYTNHRAKKTMVVRMGGFPMFKRQVQFENCVVVELTGTSVDVLTANRDGLIEPHGRQLDAFVQKIAADKHSALLPGYTTVDHYGTGDIQVGVDDPTVKSRSLIEVALAQSLKTTPSSSEGVVPNNSVVVSHHQGVKIHVGCEFVIKSSWGDRRKLPRRFIPGRSFSLHAMQLATVWVRLMTMLYTLDRRSGRFCVGFVFDNQRRAECHHEGNRHIFLLNPVNKDRQDRYNLADPADRSTLVSLAAHEYTHALGYSRHDEDYAGALTRVMGLCVEYHEVLMSCFDQDENAGSLTNNTSPAKLRASKRRVNSGRRVPLSELATALES